MTADLILTNANLVTLNPRQPQTEAVAVSGENILAVGSTDKINGFASKNTQVIDCWGRTLLPGFVDAHCHLLALAGSLSGIDCGPDIIESIVDLQQLIRNRVMNTPAGQWIRGYGYDHESLEEGRHPNRHDLDQVAPEHPVRLNHRSGHASVLNSRAMELAGIHKDTPDPVDGVIEREYPSGEPTGVFFEMSGFLRQRLAGKVGQESRDQEISLLDRKLLKYGITSVQDAGPNNDLSRWADFQKLVASGQLKSRVTMMAGAGHLHEFVEAGMRFGSGDQRLRLGHAKIMLTVTTGSLHPCLAELTEMISQAHALGFPVAIHAVEQEAVIAAAEALAETRVSGTGPADRIEHCAECPIETLRLVRRSGASVVTQPGFVYWNGDRYLERVEPGLLPHLYPIVPLHRASGHIAFSSDAPVIDPNPWPGIYASVTERTQSGSRLYEFPPEKSPGISVEDALRMYTLSGASVEGTDGRKGSIQRGKLADLVLLDADPFQVELERLKDIRSVATIIGGRVAWEDGL